ncbi:MAG: cell division protein CpoB [Enterobacterales bacterium]|uniref:Cell division coordinator CpoB n=1 Tax=Hafnia alvei ATCC 13337 TaxID=910996 RepID=A0ABD3ZGY2_HAFAL|nr:cell division protein CpoB [Hafnia alvei]MDN6228149.1 cell division protein CpoB [Enterobacterales bacterium]KFC87853.1 exported TPR repeat-containing prenylyltransferase domain protein [Hafnia alvei ATCC 13337]MCV9377617.1 cell division protein CpoB [Hafnia alvei]MDN6773659.1 cell division protein CpoB [Enterobacterales bacterium]MDX6846941.1 cell division protein CpoB [Hafnia alvei]
MSSNFRLHLLSLSLLVGIAAPWAAIAQAPISSVGSGSVEDRVTSLERITNAQGQLFSQLQQQLSDNQRDIDSLRGQIQESQYQLNQVVERQKQILLQLDSQGSANTGAAAADSAAAASTASDASSTTAAPVASTAPASSGDANTDYNRAVDLVLVKKQNDQAITAFQSFVKQYPDSTYQPNANYWLGQLFYNKGKKDDSAYYFAVVVKNYPKSPKAPDAMYKVGVIMQEKGQADKAKAVYQQVIKQYPTSDAAKQAQKRIAAS